MVGRLEIMRGGVRKTIEVPITGYDVATVRIIELNTATPRQIALRNAWTRAS